MGSMQERQDDYQRAYGQSNLSQYWQLPAQEKDKLIAQVTPLPEPYHCVVRVNGERIVPKPGGYTCKCRLADPNYCYDDTHDVEVQDGMNGTCECSCHSDCGGDW